MSVRFAALSALLVAGCAPLAATDDAHRLQLTTEARARGTALLEACEGRNGWSDPAPPARIFGSTYYVGTCGITAILIVTTNGHVLIDTGPAEAAPAILANIRALGIDPREVRTIVFTHEHHDHMGALAALAKATGAHVWSSPPARPHVEAGTLDPADPQFGLIETAPPAAVDASLGDASSIMIGDHNLWLYPFASPGHTEGGTSWSWQSCEGQDCVNFAFVDSLSAVSSEEFRFTDHPERVAPFRKTFVRVAAMPCDILLTTHPAASDLHARLAGRKPLRDPDACRAYAQRSEAALDARLAREASGAR